MLAGFMMIYKSEWLLRNFGRIGFFEKHLGTAGGSRLGYKIIGILVVAVGFMMFSGMISGFMEWVLSPLINLGKGGSIE